MRSRRRAWLGWLPSAAVGLAGAGLNGVHESHSLVLAFFSASALLALIWVGDSAVALVRRLGGIGHGVSATLYKRNYLFLDIKVDGPSMRDAGVTLTAPEIIRPLWRMAKDGSPVGDVRRGVTARLEPGGELVRANRWHEKGLHLLGGGHVTPFVLIANAEPGDYPVHLRVFDDSDFVRDADLFLTVAFRKEPPDPTHRRSALQVQQNFLRQNRDLITLALGKGYYWQGDETIRTQFQPRAWPHFDQAGKDSRLCDALGDAYEECARLAEVADSKGTHERRLNGRDGAERALAAVLHASVLIDLTLAREAA